MARKLIDNCHECPITHAMNILGSKWTPIIIYALKDKTLRFGALAVRLKSISRKVLTEQLKEMELRGIVTRKSYAEIPRRVEYALTPKAYALIPILDQLCEWSKDIQVHTS